MKFFRNLVSINKCRLFILLILIAPNLRAQDTLNMSFGNISVKDFNWPVPLADSSSGAIILADIGRSYYEGNVQGSMSVVYTRFIRVKILNKNGMGIGTYAIKYNRANSSFYYSNGTVEQISDLRAVTCNLENGIVSKTPLDSAAVFDEKFKDFYTIKKFAIPDLRVGSIYDVTYTVTSMFGNYIKSWSFQSNYPCLWSEYQVKIPESYHYNMLFQGDQHYDIYTNNRVDEKFNIKFGGDRGSSIGNMKMSGVSNEYRWVKKNEPAFTKESLIHTPKNYADQVSFHWEFFQLNQYTSKQENYSTWKAASHAFLRPPDIRECMGSDNFWLDRTVGNILGETQDRDKKVRILYYYIRNNYTCTGHYGIFPERKMYDIFKSRSGTVAELNLLLVVMLRHAGVEAHPAVLSTRENGVSNYDVPMMDEYNYLICTTYADNKLVTLDASWPKNSFGRLMPDCYNGGARMLDEDNPRFIPLFTDSLLEIKKTTVLITNDDQGIVTGSLCTTFGNERSYDIREELKKTSRTEYIKTKLIEPVKSMDIASEDLDSVNNYDVPLTMRYDMNFTEFAHSDMVYFNPVLVQTFRNNPLTSAERKYPVELPYKMDNLYLLSFDIPRGFKIEELPKSTRITLNEKEGFFDYIIEQNQESIQMQVHLKLNKSVFQPVEYASLREFFSYIVKKETEQIVFKKIQ